MDRTDKLLGRKDVCAIVDVSEDTLGKMIEEGEFPPSTHWIRGREKWAADVVMAWRLATSNQYALIFYNAVKAKLDAENARKRPKTPENSGKTTAS